MNDAEFVIIVIATLTGATIGAIVGLTILAIADRCKY